MHCSKPRGKQHHLHFVCITAFVKIKTLNKSDALRTRVLLRKAITMVLTYYYLFDHLIPITLALEVEWDVPRKRKS